MPSPLSRQNEIRSVRRSNASFAPSSCAGWPLTVLQNMSFPIYESHCHLPRLRPRSVSDFAMGLMSFDCVSSDTRRQESHVSEGVELGFIGHAYDQNERLREGKDKWQEA